MRVAGGLSDPTEEGVIKYVADHVAADYGVKIKITPVDDGNSLIKELNDSDSVDAAVLGYKPWIDGLNKTEGYHVAAVAPLFSQYWVFYSKKYKSLSELPNGASVAYRGDAPFYTGQILTSLEELGVIGLRANADPLTISTKDITSNPKHLKFVSVQSAARTLDDVDLAASQSTEFSLAGTPGNLKIAQVENKDLFAKQLAVRADRVDDPDIKKAIEAFKDPRVGEWATKNFGDLISAVDSSGA
ncbi:MetQ/NlpA family ABC transporter substrate-binding protein [Streptomyces sp. NBC_00102]|uniref:MetQ/NlpA family ABC transporter substrate-binding protein n=1 Tax=Streptomyces sp. NBC_00102 TaxID=2975652 RepID=UPI0022572D89|nr:MetQ/NlpA family ABC transporter substrate-binding protein [Streptomyces sp. NBC_00102]MCX5401335.1 MetQ/NlpA family ABC transporter substrate-binding protein [Streptomyces sp. NBC_00102]